MITTIRKGQDINNGNNSVLEMRGLSTDTKPRNISNGSMFVEINTGKQYLYDLENDQWKLIGGGGGDTPNLQDKSITITENTTTNVVADEGYDGLSSVSVITNVSGGGSSYAPHFVSFGFYPGNQEDLEEDLAGIDFSNITSMSHMFANPTGGIESLDLSDIDTSNVTDMEGLFYENTASEIDLTGWNTQNVTKMNQMFSGCRNLGSIDVSSLDTGNVEDMGYMFSDCESLTSLNLSGFDTSSCTTLSGMFSNCSSLTALDLSSFTANENGGITMDDMFSSCSSLTSVDMSGFDFTKASTETIPNMFGYDYTQITIPFYVKDQASKTILEQNNPNLTNVQIKA